MVLVCCAVSPAPGVFEYRGDPHEPYPTPTARIAKQVVINVCDLAARRLDIKAARAVVESPRTHLVWSYDNERVLGMYCRILHFGYNRSTTQFVDVCDLSVGDFRKAVVASGWALPEGCERGIEYAALLGKQRIESLLMENCGPSRGTPEDKAKCRVMRLQLDYYRNPDVAKSPVYE